MIAVIFEVEPREGGAEAYLDIAANLRPLLDGIDGFISVERFESLAAPGKYLSLSFWRDEEAVAAWRNLEAHQRAQATGRQGLFRSYRLRVAHVVRDYGRPDQVQASPETWLESACQPRGLSGARRRRFDEM